MRFRTRRKSTRPSPKMDDPETMTVRFADGEDLVSNSARRCGGTPALHRCGGRHEPW